MDLNNLMDNVRSFFSEQYKGVEHTESYIAFEPLGSMIDPEDFKDENDAISEIKAMEQLSILGDRLPEIDDIFFANTSRMSVMYEVLVESSRFDGSKITLDDKTGYIAKFSEVQSESRKKIEDGDKASIITPEGSYLPIYANPKKWYDPEASFWVNKKFSTKEPSPDKPAKPNTMVGKPIPMLWRTKLMANPELLKVAVEQPKTMQKLNPNTIQKSRLRLDTINIRDHRTIAIDAKQSNLTSRFQRIRPELKTDSALLMKIQKPLTEPKQAVRNLNILKNFKLSDRILVTNHLVTTDKVNVEPVQSNEFSMSFDYCIVNLNRPWYNTELFHFSNIWYALSLNEGYFSNGLKDESNRGVFKSIPYAMILIKNMRIKASWTDDEKANAADNVGLGIFNLKDSKFINNELVTPGMQIIGWICEVIPRLPVSNDPNLVT